MAMAAVRQAFGNVSSSTYLNKYDRLARSVQIGVVVGKIFCAECYPMHTWRGFGASVRGEYDWAEYWVACEPWDLLDRSIAFLKASPKSFTLLKKYPAGIERYKPWRRDDEKKNNERTWKEGKKNRTALEDLNKDFNKRAERKGFPQPIDKSYSITTWSIPFATWGSKFSVNNEGHSWTNCLRHQMDPGRLFHAFVIGGHLNLRAGEVMVIPAGPAECMVRWIEGLEGMSFRIIEETTLDFKKLGLKSSTKKAIKTFGVHDAYVMQDAAAGATDSTDAVSNAAANITTMPQSDPGAFKAPSSAPQSPSTPQMPRMSHDNQGYAHQTAPSMPLPPDSYPSPRHTQATPRKPMPPYNSSPSAPHMLDRDSSKDTFGLGHTFSIRRRAVPGSKPPPAPSFLSETNPVT